MQSEIIFIPNIKLLTIEKKRNYYTTNIQGIEKTLTFLEPIGKPFSVITKGKSDKTPPFKETKEFKELLNNCSQLESYLREAEAEFTLSRREDNLPQYLGIEYGNPAIMEVINNFEKNESNLKRSIFPCKFYLIKDKI